MRLGAYPCVLEKGTLAAEAYGTTTISERHRHRYEVSNRLPRGHHPEGPRALRTSPDQRLVEMIELKDHPYFVGCQFHPEFKSRPQASTRSSRASSAPAWSASVSARRRASARAGMLHSRALR